MSLRLLCRKATRKGQSESRATNANVTETRVNHLNGIRLEASNEGVGETCTGALNQSRQKPRSPPRVWNGHGQRAGEARNAAAD
jgi:hypothetical protein